MDKENIKKELINKSNNILTNHNENDIVESISIMNMSSKTVFLGSLRVFDEDKVKEIKKDLKKELNSFGELTIRDEKIIPCCAPKYTHISFNISITN